MSFGEIGATGGLLTLRGKVGVKARVDAAQTVEAAEGALFS